MNITLTIATQEGVYIVVRRDDFGRWTDDQDGDGFGTDDDFLGQLPWNGGATIRTLVAEAIESTRGRV